MSLKYLNIYNNLIKLTRNKKLYENLGEQERFSHRLNFLLFHIGFLLNIYKNQISKDEKQRLFDFIIIQIELSIREIGYGDVSVNKNMKNYINHFYSIVDKIESWESSNIDKKKEIIAVYVSRTQNLSFYVDYFEKYRVFLLKNTLKELSKDILNFKF